MECLLKLAKQRCFDGRVVRHLLHLLTLFPLNSLVTLSDGGIAQVLRRDGENYEAPIVKRLSDSEGNAASDKDGPVVVKLGESDLRIVHALPTPGRDEIALSERIVALSHR